LEVTYRTVASCGIFFHLREDRRWWTQRERERKREDI